MATWVIEDILARSGRPGYPSQNVQLNEVDTWLKKISAMRIKTIICLLANKQLSYYSTIPKGLLEYYRQQGFRTEHIPITDPFDNKLLGQQELKNKRESIYLAFLELPKPVLVHSGAGLQRTGPTVEYIRKRWSEGFAPVDLIS